MLATWDRYRNAANCVFLQQFVIRVRGVKVLREGHKNNVCITYGLYMGFVGIFHRHSALTFKCSTELFGNLWRCFDLHEVDPVGFQNL